MTKYNELLKAILLPQFDRENFEKNYDDLMKMVLQMAKKRKYITLDIHGNISDLHNTLYYLQVY